MLWTAEAVEDLKKLALEGKSASHISAALGVGVPKRGHRQGEPDRDQTWRRRARPRNTQAARGSPSMGERSLPPARRPPITAPKSPACARSPGQAGGGEGGVDAWRSRDRRDAAGEVRGNSRIRLSLAAWRSKKRGIRLLRAHAGQGPVLLRRPLPDGLSRRPRRGEGARSGKGCAPREFVAAFVSQRACLAPA